MTIKILDKKPFPLVLIFFVLISYTASSQKVGIGLQASINHALIPNVEKKPFRNQSPLVTGYSMIAYNPGINEVYREKVGGKINMNIDFMINAKLFLRTGIGFSLQRFKRKVVDEENEAPYLDNWTMKEGPPKKPIVTKNDSDSAKTGNFGGNYVGVFTAANDYFWQHVGIGNTSIVYTDIPLLIGVNLFKNKINICAGTSTSILTYSTQDAIRTTHIDENYNFKTVKLKNNSNDGLTNVLVNISSSVTYNFARKISLFTRYSKQLNTIYEKKYQYAGKAKLQSFEFGVEYRIK